MENVNSNYAAAAKTNRDRSVVTFTINNGQAYETDPEVLSILRGLVKDAEKIDDNSAVVFMMDIGEESGRIRRMRSS